MVHAYYGCDPRIPINERSSVASTSGARVISAEFSPRSSKVELLKRVT